MNIIDIWLPYPPSVNRYYRRSGYAVYISSIGKKFKEEVIQEVHEQVGELLIAGAGVMGSVHLSVTLYPPHINRRRDLDNCLKILQDSITESGLWRDDEQVKRVTADWGDVNSKLNSRGGCANIRISEYQPKKIVLDPHG